MIVGRVIGRCFSVYKPQLRDIVGNYTKVSNVERLQLLAEKCRLSVTAPEDGDNISQVSDLTSFAALLDIRERMMDDPVGRQILEQKPRITDQIIDSLKGCKEGTFGKGYHDFMSSHGFHPHQRPLVKYIPDLELAYVLQRYKQIHDFLHVLLIKQISINDQLIVKWFQMTQLKLPSTSLAALVSPFMMGPAKAYEAFTKDIPQTIERAKRCQFVMNIYFQKHFDTDLEEFKREIGLIK